MHQHALWNSSDITYRIYGEVFLNQDIVYMYISFARSVSKADRYNYGPFILATQNNRHITLSIYSYYQDEKLIQWTGKSTSILPPSKQGREYRLQRVWACRVWCPKSPLPMGASGPPSNTWFLGSPWVHIPNGISTDAAVLAQLMLMTNRQSDVQITLQRKQQGPDFQNFLRFS